MVIIVGICAFIFGLSLGLLSSNIRTQSVGTLRIDQSDPDEGPYLFLELSEDPRQLMSKTYVKLKVNPKNYISHK